MMAIAMEPLFKLLYVVAGAFLAGFFTTNSPSAIEQIEKMFPDLSQHTYAKIDFLLVVVAGSSVGYLLLTPADQGKAFMSGLSAVALFRQIVAENDQRLKKGKTK
jgi:hypothetical protein